MYYNYFGLTEAPFSISPNPDYLLKTVRHQEALAHLYHGVQSDAGFVLLTGDIGTGKTTVCRCFLESLAEDTRVAFILNPFLGTRELLLTLCQELGIDGVPETASLRKITEAIYRQLLQNFSSDIQTVLLIDEAQHLHYKVLEMIRLLTNLETDTQKLLKIILVGQPELNDTLDKPELTQLSQRITARYHIGPLTLAETGAYIDYRLRMAGYLSEKKLFPPPIVKKIYEFSRGVPRLINVICDRSLLGAYSQNQGVVTGTILTNAINEVKGRHRLKNDFWRRWLPLAAVIGVLLLSLPVYFLWLRSINPPSPMVVMDNTEAERPAEVSVAVPPPAVTPVPAEVETNPLAPPKNVFYPQRDNAIAALIGAIVAPQTTATDCGGIPALGWSCQQVTTDQWSDLLRFNRPAVIRLVNDSNTAEYVPVISLTDTDVTIVTPAGTTQLLLQKLQQSWGGEITYLWQPPSAFDDHIYFGSPAAVVNWLAGSFAAIDNRTDPLAKDQFTSVLKQRIILFQRQHKLREDGIAGIETVLKINESLGKAVTLSAVAKTVSARAEGPLILGLEKQ